MPIIDNLGIWEDIGIVTPSLDWQVFPYFCKSPNSIFRVFYGNIAEATNSAYLRAMYFDGGSYTFDQRWLRLFPKDEPEIINYPFPPDLIKDPLPVRQFQIIRKVRYRRTRVYGFSPDSNWTVQLFEKQDSKVIYPIGSNVTGNVGAGDGGGGVIVGSSDPGIIPGSGL